MWITIEIDDELLRRAKQALGLTSTRATVEEALRRVADPVQPERADAERKYLTALGARVDLDVLRSNEMWR